MAIKQYDFKPIVSNCYFSGISFTVCSPDASTPKDLTGVAIILEIKKPSDTISTNLFSTTAGTIVVTIPSGGSVLNKVTLLGANINLPAGNYVYTMYFLFPDGGNRPYLTGTWVVKPKI